MQLYDRLKKALHGDGGEALVLQIEDRLDAGLAVERVGDRLDQIEVDPALV